MILMKEKWLYDRGMLTYLFFTLVSINSQIWTCWFLSHYFLMVIQRINGMVRMFKMSWTENREMFGVEFPALVKVIWNWKLTDFVRKRKKNFIFKNCLFVTLFLFFFFLLISLLGFCIILRWFHFLINLCFGSLG